MEASRIGFIGFGEAGFHLAKGLRGAGVAQVFAFDIQSNSPDAGPRIRERAAATRTTLVRSSEELAAVSDILFSAVTASSALDAAQQAAPFLDKRHIYVDINSVSPALKQAIGNVIDASGAGFVEAAVMAPVPPYGHRVPMLLGGAGAESFVLAMSPLGMRLQQVSGEVGAAAAVKMCRSIVVKGLEALLFECVLSAAQFGAEDRVFASLDESFPGIDWKKLTNYAVGRVVVHGERRAHEMEEVAETLRSIGVDPIMAEAAARRQGWSAEMRLREEFGPEGPSGYADVIQVLKKRV